MSTQKITISNPTRIRKWGWEYSTAPTGRDAYSIALPTKPYYTGTLKQVQQSIANDKTFKSVKSGGTFYNAAWFYNGKRIVNKDEFVDWLGWGMEQGWPCTIEIAA